MMNLWKKMLAFLLAVVFCLNLAACGGSDSSVEEPTGDDWRNSGVVVDSGTITHENEGSVYVLVTVDENRAAFYWDEPEQILFDSVSFPMVIPDAQQYFDGIYFDDISGDGESDVCVNFVYGPDDILSLVWIWDPVERYVYREDLSTLRTESGDISEYIGLWEYVDEDVWIRIYEDETWECLDARGVAFQFGTLSTDADGVTFYSDDYEETPRFDRTASGTLYDAENDGTLVLVYDNPFNNIDISEYVGLWKYEDINLWLRIYDDDTWDFFNDQEDVIQSGTLQTDATSIMLYFDGTGEELQLDCSTGGCLIDCDDGSVLYPADSIESDMPYFTRYGLESNAVMEMGTYWLDDGVCSYAAGDQFNSLGDNYTLGECYWEAIKYYDDIEDGIREIQFDAFCYIPYSSLDDFGGAIECSVYHQLFDSYTGKWFTRIDDYKTSSRGDDYYVHTVEWNGQSGIIEFTRSSDWQSDVDGWARVVTVTYHIFLPEWYDGLVFVTEPLPDNYEDFARFDSQHRDYAEASIMDIDLLDPYGCLIFNVCDEYH